MAVKRKPILIGCPQFNKLMRGSYECDDEFEYLLAPDGSFVLDRVQCGHDGGRCAETLCALHRHNRRGPATWYPSKILAMTKPSPPKARARRKSAGKARTSSARKRDGGMDLLC